jgi:rare lipoprotein A
MNGRSLIPVVASLLVTAVASAHVAPHRMPATATPAIAPAREASSQHGTISYYGSRFAGRRTANGERFDPQAMTMAHRSLPLGTIVEVTNDANGRRVRLRVNDRGPVPRDRMADVTAAASERLGFRQKGLTKATIEVVSLPGGETLAAR